MVATLVVAGAFLKQMFAGLGLQEVPWVRPVRVATSLGIVVLGYAAWVRWTEQRRVTELTQVAPKPLIEALSIGLLLPTLSFFTVWLCGGYHLAGLQSPDLVEGILLYSATPAVVEETFARGLALRLIAEAVGWGPALGVTTAIFGAAHLGNDGMTLWPLIAVALGGGVMVGAYFRATGSLLGAMVLHGSWNGVQALVLGTGLTGAATRSLLVVERAGPTWLNGGAFGIEASAITAVLLGAVSVHYLRRAPARATHGSSRGSGMVEATIISTDGGTL